MNPTTTRWLIPDEIRARMVDYIAARDRLPRDQAERAMRSLGAADLIRLELALRNRPQFESNYDPFGR